MPAIGRSTPVAQIYDQFVFAAGLWALAIGVSVTLWVAMFHLWHKRIAQHQAYMALNFGLLLTAPLLRMGWLVFPAPFAVDPCQLQIKF